MEWDDDEPQQDRPEPEHSPDYQQIQQEIMALSAKVVELRAQNEQQERSLHEFTPTENDSYNPKRKQWTSTAPTKRSTAIGSDTNSEIISTITSVSTR